MIIVKDQRELIPNVHFSQSDEDELTTGLQAQAVARRLDTQEQRTRCARLNDHSALHGRRSASAGVGRQ
jgi:hypothetical protein